MMRLEAGTLTSKMVKRRALPVNRFKPEVALAVSIQVRPLALGTWTDSSTAVKKPSVGGREVLAKYSWGLPRHTENSLFGRP